ncbi:MAG: hypothetical protein ACTHU0_24710 [Kofleriaceae bacterium]
MSAFLPWASAAFASVSGTDGGDGWLVVGTGSAALLAVLLGDRTAAPTKGGRILYGLMGAASALLGIVKIADLYDLKSKAGQFGNAINIGIGLWVLAAAGIMMAVLSMRAGAQAASAAKPASAGSSASAASAASAGTPPDVGNAAHVASPSDAAASPESAPKSEG